MYLGPDVFGDVVWADHFSEETQLLWSVLLDFIEESYEALLSENGTDIKYRMADAFVDSLYFDSLDEDTIVRLFVETSSAFKLRFNIGAGLASEAAHFMNTWARQVISSCSIAFVTGGSPLLPVLKGLYP